MYLRRNRESYRQRRGLGSCRLLWTGLILVAYSIILSSHRMQAKLSTEELQLLSGFLGINHADLRSELGEHWWPNRGLGPIPPTDPVIYRLYEVRPF
jgi:cyanate lyase